MALVDPWVGDRGSQIDIVLVQSLAAHGQVMGLKGGSKGESEEGVRDPML